ncbi:hypothetical protein N0V83_002922 [Neocucurbitaria cava]|uniref:N-acetyltransferase domain-containing protein n=1 Tax=Neocucurbitaria cava TaxID=798079 RepID=A0A9W8YDN2_9PLEO|nr:hypothetical protein N0V83_002922 [Neocucurbitaria cava]
MAEPTEITIRPRDPSDIPTLITILTAVHTQSSYPVDGPSTFLQTPTPNALLSLVALYNSTLAGHAQLLPASVLNSVVTESLKSTHDAPITSFATLVSLFVDPKLQGKGIGRRLVEEAVAWGRKEGRRLVLVVLEKDGAAIRMYEGMGWERGGVEYFYESIQGVEYRAFLYLAPPPPPV